MRAATGWPDMNDFRYALRQLLKSPGFTFVAVVTLALGLAANTTILNMIRAFFFEPLPVKGSNRLVFVMQKTDVIEFPHGYSWLDFKDLRANVPAFEDALSLMTAPVNLGGLGGEAERTWIEFVSGNYFTMLGMPPALGGVFTAEVDTGDGAPVVVLSHAYWQRKFGGDRSVVGRSVMLNGRPATVLGIMPASFSGAQWAVGTSAWVPAACMPQLMEGGKAMLESRAAVAFKILARLTPEATLEQARAATTVALGRIAEAFPKDHREAQVVLAREMHSRPEPSLSGFMPVAAVVFLGLVLFVLLIACANVANLMFARALARRREMGIRAAVGASRWRLLRQLLIESVTLSMLAGVAGAILAQASGTALNRLVPTSDLPMQPHESSLWSGLLGTLVVAMLAGLGTGLIPALRATQPDIHGVLKAGSGALTGGTRHPFRSALVILQVGLCLVVLVCGGLFMESLRQASRADLGFRTDGVLMASLDVGLQRYDGERGRQFYRELMRRLRALPGVKEAALGSHVPFDYGMRLMDVAAEGSVDAASDSSQGTIAAAFAQVSTNYARTLGITLLQGRDFDAQDTATSPKVALINQTLARKLWGEQDPIGKRLWLGKPGELCDVVGLVRDGKYLMLGEAPRPFLFRPLEQDHTAPITVHLRVAGDPLALVSPLRREISQLDPDLPLYAVRTMTEHLQQSALALMPLRMAATLAGVQGLLGLCLAVMGVYGVVAYVVGQRTREIGIRVALGARRLDVVKLVIRQGWHLTLIGLGAGLAVSFLMALGLSRLLFGLNPLNVPVFAGAVVTVAGIALLACYLPARQALRVDPVLALRSE